MQNLLIQLRKYRRRENSDPLENFLTEAFAWLLNSSPVVCNAVLELINQNLELPVDSPLEAVEVSTQENFNGFFPDMVMSWSGCSLVFEHKVHAQLHSAQLDNYRQHMSGVGVDYRIVLITARRHQHEQMPDAALCWEQVYGALNMVKEDLKEEVVVWAINDFLALLRHEGLGPREPINRIGIAYYSEAIALERKIASLMDAAQHEPWPLLKFPQIAVDKKAKRYGRIGLDFGPMDNQGNRMWRPGVFCGFLMDGTDHCAEGITDREPHLAVIFDFDLEAQRYYKEGREYTVFLAEFSERCRADLTEWRLWDMPMLLGNKANFWHPLILSMPMSNLFDGVTSADEQLSVFRQHISQVQECLLRCPSFFSLVDKLGDLERS